MLLLYHKFSYIAIAYSEDRKAAGTAKGGK